MCRCSVFNRSRQTVDSRDLETRSYALQQFRLRHPLAPRNTFYRMITPTLCA